MDLGAPELLVILVVVLFVFGGRKLPELARGSGRALRIFKDEVTSQDDEETADGDLEARHAAERASLEARQASERRSSAEGD
jgi:sec-independent protein translocase protein TatA